MGYCVTMSPRVHVCADCGCRDVEAEAWVSLNDPTEVEFQEGGKNWCPYCGDHLAVTMIDANDAPRTEEFPECPKGMRPGFAFADLPDDLKP